MGDAKIVLGTVQLGLNYGISNTLGRPDISSSYEILRKAIALNIDILDTAPGYGDSESVIGSFGSDKFRVVSKFMPPAIGYSISDQLNDSLLKLKSSYLYGYIAHRAASLTTTHWQTLLRLKEDGKVQKLGVSLQTVQEGERMINIGIVPDLVQVPFNYFDRRFEALCRHFKTVGTEIHARSPFLQGLFFLNEESLHGQFLRVREHVIELQRKYGANLTGFLLKIVTDQPFIDYVVMGVQSSEQLTHNCRSLKTDCGYADKYQFDLPDTILDPALWVKS